MSNTICIALKDALYYPEAGGHLWIFLNWALGFQALGYRVILLSQVDPHYSDSQQYRYVRDLKANLAPYGFAENVALASLPGEKTVPKALAKECLDLDAAAEADLLLNMDYELDVEIVKRFRRSALLDIDPGLLQTWVSQGNCSIQHHDFFFTTGETVGTPLARFPDLGIKWEYTPPCVALDWWHPTPPSSDGSFNTIAHLYAGSGIDKKSTSDDKRSAFMKYLELPQHSAVPLELALHPKINTEDRDMFSRHGWHIANAHEVASSPLDYQHYIQTAYGEFSCVKPATVHLQNAWISDRSVCYLAAGKPVIVEHTGPSRFLPNAAGMFRFRNLDEAIFSINRVVEDYDQQSALARALAEEYFDSRRGAEFILARTLP